MESHITEDSLVLLYFDNKRQWLIRAKKGKEFHTHKGFIKVEEMIGKPFGSNITSSLGQTFWLLRPTIHDLIMHSARKTQIMYPKDIGLVILKLSLSAGTKVLEIGTGSGGMTMAAAMAVRPTGHVDTYEARDEFAEVAERNLRKASLAQYVTIHRRDARTGVEGTNFDAAIIDIGDPWEIILHAHKALAGGAPMVSFSPTMNQVEKSTAALHQAGFENITTLECLMREIRAEVGKTRPATMMVGHTGYMTFAQKILSQTGTRSAGIT